MTADWISLYLEKENRGIHPTEVPMITRELKYPGCVSIGF